jgi:hypothetical protein
MDVDHQSPIWLDQQGFALVLAVDFLPQLAVTGRVAPHVALQPFSRLASPIMHLVWPARTQLV